MKNFLKKLLKDIVTNRSSQKDNTFYKKFNKFYFVSINTKLNFYGQISNKN